MSEYIQVSTTLEKRDDARRMAGALVEKRLAACAQIAGPILSVYWWKGRMEEAEEWLLILKTRKDLYDRLEGEIRELHPYDVPEIVAVPLAAGSPDYLRWIDEELAFSI
ncbi:MAG: divalent-cation tolerance protein CutA [Deltaproteobacteria bacterium]|nr:divalent-cation tolerance protein CutA [Deltaproteobacteria bacterium]